jgi:hypothetical protein
VRPALLETHRMYVSDLLRRRVRELEEREDYHALHRLLSGWPLPAGDRPSVTAAFDAVMHRVAEHDERLA